MHGHQLAVTNFQSHTLLFIAPFHAITIITHMKTTYLTHKFTHRVIKYFYLFYCFTTSPADNTSVLSDPPSPEHVCRVFKLSYVAPEK